MRTSPLARRRSATIWAQASMDVLPVVKRSVNGREARHGLMWTPLPNPSSVAPRARNGSGNLHRVDEWSFCLTAARMAAEKERQ